MQAGLLRHLVTIEQRADAPDANGDVVTTWTTFAANVPAQVEPLSARELVAAQATQSQISATVTIRYLAGITSAMRLRRADGRIYNIAGIVEDHGSGRAWVTIPVTQGVNDG